MYTVFPNLIHYDFDYPFYKMSKDPNFIVVKNASKELINAFKTLQAYIDYSCQAETAWLTNKNQQTEEESHHAKKLYARTREHFMSIIRKFNPYYISKEEDLALSYAYPRLKNLLHEGTFRFIDFATLADRDWEKILKAIPKAMALKNIRYAPALKWTLYPQKVLWQS